MNFSVLNCFSVWSVLWESAPSTTPPPEGRGGGCGTLGWCTCASLFWSGGWIESFSPQTLTISRCHSQSVFPFFNFSSLCPPPNGWLIAAPLTRSWWECLWGQVAVVRQEFMVESAMSLTLNRLPCNFCMKSPRGPGHPVDFPPNKSPWALCPSAYKQETHRGRECGRAVTRWRQWRIAFWKTVWLCHKVHRKLPQVQWFIPLDGHGEAFARNSLKKQNLQAQPWMEWKLDRCQLCLLAQ